MVVNYSVEDRFIDATRARLDPLIPFEGKGTCSFSQITKDSIAKKLARYVRSGPYPAVDMRCLQRPEVLATQR